MSTKTLLYLLLTFLLIINISHCQLIYSRRVSISETASSNIQQQYDVLYKQDGSIVYNQTNNFIKYDVVISINSFTQGSRIKVSVIAMKRNAFTIQTHKVNELSYILVQISETWKVGSLCLYFPPSGLMPHSSLMTTTHQIKSPSQYLHQLATVQPFISQLSLGPLTFMQTSSLKSTAIVRLEWSWYTHNLTIIHSPDIRKVCVSYLMYVKLSNRNNLFFDVRRPNGLEFFSNRRSRDKIFLGLRSVEIVKGGSQSQYGNKAFIQWEQSLRANLNGITPQVYLLLEQQTNCSYSSILNAVYSPADPTLCINECDSKIIVIEGRKICIQNISIDASSATAVSMVEVVREINGNVCELPINASQFVACKKCNTTSYFTGLYDNSCFCKIGYQGYVIYPQQSSQTNYYVDNEWMWTCRPCNSQTCVFSPSMSANLVLNSMNNSYGIQINLSFNNASQNINPYGDTKYSDIQLSITINSQQTSFTLFPTPTPSQYKILIPSPAYSPTYNYSIEIRSKSSIALVHSYPSYRAQVIYLTQSFTLTQSVSLQTTSSLLASSIENISNSIAITSLVSLMLGAKLSLFSFMQVSSIMYLSVFVKWNNYGSIDRLNLLRMLFRMEPSNLIASLGAHLNINKLYSDDSGINNVALNHYQKQLYITLVPQYLISALINVFIVQLIIQILTLILKPAQPPQCHLPFHKPRYLTTHILSQSETIGQKLSKSISNSLPKRLTFYLTLFTSQLAYHSFMIFSQFHIHLSTTTQIVNLFFTLAVLGIIFGVVALGSSHPMVLFKAVGVLAKKRQYTYGGLYLFWVISAMEMIVYGASLAIFTQSYSQCLPLILITVLKLILAIRKIKPLELIKSILLLSYFIILSVGTLFPVENQKILQQCSIFLIILICVIEFAKILRSIVVLIIGILRGKLSTDGIAISEKIKMHLRKQREQKQEQKNQEKSKLEQLKNKNN